MYGLKVAIVGGGIGGLTAGIALQQVGYEVETFERVQQLRPAGAGISLWSNGIKVLNRLGIGEEIAAIGGEMNVMEYRTHGGKLLNQISLLPLFERVGQRPYPVARTDLQRVLLEAFGEERVQLGRESVGVEQDAEQATVLLTDGGRVSADVVIAADGVRSRLRKYVLGRSQSPRYAGYVNWNGLVKASDVDCDPDCWVLYVGEGKRASMMPVGGDHFYFFFGCPMDAGSQVDPVDRQEELAGIFAGWAEPVQGLIRSIDPMQTNRLEICDLDPLEAFVRGRVALLGDSAHASTPTLGQGGCQAIEDAELLTRCLVTTNIGVEDALRRYEAARQGRTAELVLKARKRTDTIYGKDMAVTEGWYRQLELESPGDVVNALAKVILAGPMG